MDPERTFAAQVAQLTELKAEHRPILEQIAADPGMLPQTRRLLVEHVLEEEEEGVQELARTLRQRPPSASAGRPDRRAGGLSVGSLRPPEAPWHAGGASVGTLRPY